RFGVLCRFTAFVAVDVKEVVNPGGQVHRVIQPVEPAAGWGMLGTDREDAQGLECYSLSASAPRSAAKLKRSPPPAAAPGKIRKWKGAAPRDSRSASPSQGAGGLLGTLFGSLFGGKEPPAVPSTPLAPPPAPTDLAAYRRRAL